MIGIYKVTNLINGNSYIGQSTDIRRRFYEHRCISHEGNDRIKQDLKMYGKNNFKYEVLEECEESELDERERYYISKLKPEYNVAAGGKSGSREYPDYVIEKISKKAKEQWQNMSEEERVKIVTHNLKGPRKGHPVSEETRQKLRDKNLGKKQSHSTIEKRKETFRLKKLNGYTRTNAHCRKRVVCIETGEVFESVKSAGESLGVNPSNISAILKGRQKSVKGLHFKYWEV